jgi:hypothetical protein
MPVCLLAAARADAEASLGVAATSVQAIRAEIVAAFIAAKQRVAANAAFAEVTERDFASLHQVQLAPIERCFAGKIQRNHGKSIKTWKLLCVPST